jgi:hypothetical protein
VRLRAHVSRGWLIAWGLLGAALLGGTPPILAGEKDDAARARNAASVMQEIMSAPDSGIPRGLMDKATAIAVNDLPSRVLRGREWAGRNGKA